MRRAERSAPGLAQDAEVITDSWTDPGQFAVLFDRHAPVIYRYVARCAGREAADDLVADTFLAAFEKRLRYDLGCPDARPWLYGIATNLIGQHRREQARRHRIMQAVRPEPDLPGHDDRVAADETARALRGPLAAALASLPALPTSAAAMGRYLQRTQKLSLGSPVADLDSLGKGVSDQLEDVYLSPRQLAAVYQFMADTPGITVVPNAADATGRHGIGIRWPVADGQVADPGYTAMIIFNPHTGAFLGQRTTYAARARRCTRATR